MNGGLIQVCVRLSGWVQLQVLVCEGHIYVAEYVMCMYD